MKPPNRSRRNNGDRLKRDEEDSDRPAPIKIDLDELIQRYGVSRDFSNPESVGVAVQKLSAEILVLQQLLLLEKVRLHSLGEYPFPLGNDFKSYGIALECFSRAWGYGKIVDIQAAINTVESQGYRIEAIRKIQESQEE